MLGAVPVVVPVVGGGLVGGPNGLSVSSVLFSVGEVVIAQGPHAASVVESDGLGSVNRRSAPKRGER